MLKLVTTAGGLVVGAPALAMNMKVTKLEGSVEQPKPHPEAASPGTEQAKPEEEKAAENPKAKAPKDIEMARLRAVARKAKDAERKAQNICDGIVGYDHVPPLYVKNSEDNCSSLGAEAGGKDRTFKPRRNIPDDGKNVKFAFTMEDWRKHHIDEYGRVDEGKKNLFWLEKCCVEDFVGQNICLGLKDPGVPEFGTPASSDANCAAKAKHLPGTWKKKEKAEVKFTQEEAENPDSKQLTKRWVEGCCEEQATTKEKDHKDKEGSCGGDDGSCR